MKPELRLIRMILARDGGHLQKLAPGIYCFCSARKLHEGPLKFFITWDPEQWQLGEKNPKLCQLVLEFKYLAAEQPDGGDLVGHLKNILKPLKEGLKFYDSHKYLNLKSVEVELPSTAN